MRWGWVKMLYVLLFFQTLRGRLRKKLAGLDGHLEETLYKLGLLD